MKRGKSLKLNQRGVGEADAQIGGRLRAMRIDRKITQDELAKAVGVSFQQIQKYEKGVNRISASRLNQLATLLKTTPQMLAGWGNVPQVDGFDFDAESYKLAKSFSLLPDHLKGKFRSLINSIISNEAGNG